MLPPNLSYITDNLIAPALQTLQIALLGTLLSIVLAVPVSLLAARNLSPNAWLYHSSRQVLNVLRGINEIILALIFVAAVGLGPLPVCWRWQCMVQAWWASSSLKRLKR